MQFLAPSSVADVLDRITILEIKRERIGSANVERELSALLACWGDLAIPSEREELRAVNLALWEVEDRLRAMEAADDFGPAFVDAARSVYRLNDRRAGLKRAINERFGSTLREEKSHPRYGG